MNLLERLRSLTHKRDLAAEGVAGIEPAAGDADGATYVQSGELVELEYRKLLADLESVRRSIADATTVRRRLEAGAQVEVRAHEAASQRAQVAVREGRDDLARAAMREAVEAERRLASRRRPIDALADRDRELRADAARLQARVDGYRDRFDAVRARGGKSANG